MLDIFIGYYFLRDFSEGDSIVRISSKTIGQTKTIRVCIPSYRRISHSHFSEIYQFREIENLGEYKATAHRRIKIIVGFRTQRSEEHTSELQSRGHLVCRLLLEKKKKQYIMRLL